MQAGRNTVVLARGAVERVVECLHLLNRNRFLTLRCGQCIQGLSLESDAGWRSSFGQHSYPVRQLQSPRAAFCPLGESLRAGPEWLDIGW